MNDSEKVNNRASEAEPYQAFGDIINSLIIVHPGN